MSIYRVAGGAVEQLGDLPGAGSISRPSVLIDYGYVYAAYHTQQIDRDYPPFFGALLPTTTMVVRIPAGNLFMVSTLGR
jgi:hypothetical protein